MYNYIITSDDKALAYEKIEEIKQNIPNDYDITSYDLEEDYIYEIVDDLSTVSLFDNPKFCVVKSANKIESVDSSKLTELLTVMNDFDSSNVLVFLMDETVNNSNANISNLKKYATNIDIRLRNVKKDDYIKKEMAKAGYSIDDDAIALLVTYSTNISDLKQSVEKLICYKAQEKIINSNDIVTLIAKPLDENVYELLNALLIDDKKTVFQIYNDLKINNKSLSLLPLLINKFQELYNVYILVNSKSSQQEIADLFNITPNRAYYMIKSAKSINPAKLKENLNQLYKLEYDIKSGKIEEGLGVELFLLR